MKTFKIKSVNRTTLILTVIPTVLILSFIGFRLFLEKVFVTSSQYVAIAAVLVVIFIVFSICKRIATSTYTVEIDEHKLSITKAGKATRTISLNQISKLGFKIHAQGCMLSIEASGFEFFKFDVSPKQAQLIQDVIAEFQKYNHYNVVEGENRSGAWTNYVNPEAVKFKPSSHKQQHKRKVNSKPKGKLIGAGVILAIIALLFAPFFINPKAFYKMKDEKVYFGNSELVGVNPKEARTLSYHVLKDSSHIYYKDQVLEWADRETFQCIHEPFYMDKNGLYYETSNFYIKNRIKPLEGEYDAATFRPVNEHSSTLYKDKNQLYEIDVFAQPPLRKISIANLDVESFQMLNNSYWYADKNYIYFRSEGTLKQCLEIDRVSFEILSLEIVKDKNHVYFLTSHLTSDHGVKGEHKGYKLLEGADAPTFKKLDDKRFVDKNDIWTISSEQEKKEPKANRREDVE